MSGLSELYAPLDPAWRVAALARLVGWAGLAWLGIGVMFAFISTSDSVGALLAGVVASVGHLLACRAAAKTIERKLRDGAWRAEATIDDGPRRWMRGAWLRVLGRSGGVAVAGAGSGASLFIGDALLFTCVLGAALMIRQSTDLDGLPLTIGLLCACSFLFMVISGACAIWAARGVSRASQDHQMIRHVAAARQAQGGELSTPVEATAGELSMVHHQQRGGLEVHEVATDEAVEAAVVLDLDGAEAATSAPAEAHHSARGGR